MKYADDIEKAVRNFCVAKTIEVKTTTGMDKRIINDALAAHEQSKRMRPSALPLNIRRTIMKNRTIKLAAAAVIIVVVSIGISYIAKDHRGSVALGDVVKAMQEVKTATWTSIREFVPPEDMTDIVQYSVDGESHSAYKAPGHEREEGVSRNMRVSEGGSYLDERRWIHIYDFKAGKSLSLNPENMTASVNTFEPAHRIASLFDAFLSPKTGIPPDAEALGTKQIDGREAFGFRFYLKGDGTDFSLPRPVTTRTGGLLR
jgi:hypothetical protein